MDETILTILKEAVASPGIDLVVIEEKLQLSKKKLEYYLKKTNQLLVNHNFPVIYRKKRKIWVSLDNVDLNKLISELKEEQRHYLSLGLRRSMLQLIILTVPRCSLSFLASRVNVSKNTVVNDLTAIRKSQKKGIILNYTRKSGYYFQGEEISIRILLIRQLHRVLEAGLDAQFLSDFLPLNLLELSSLREALIRFEHQLNTQFSDRQMKLLPIVIALMKKRAAAGQLITESEYRKIKTTVLDSDYDRISSQMKKIHFLEELPKAEQSFLIIQILSANVVKSKIMRTNQLGQLIDQTIRLFEMKAVLYIEDRDKLSQLLYQHMGPAIYRLKYGIPYEDNDIEEIIQEYKLIFPLVRESLKPIEEVYHVHFTEIEIIYVGLIFQSFLTKGYLKGQKRRIRAIVICENGISVSNLLFETLIKIFPMIDFIANLSVREFYDNSLIYSEIEVIFSTIYLETNQQVFTVTPFLTELEENRLIEQVNQKLYGRTARVDIQEIMNIVKRKASTLDEAGLQSELHRYFQRSVFVDKMNVEKSDFNRLLPVERIKVTTRKFTFQEAIQAVGEPLLKDKIIEQQFIDTIIQKYDERYPYFVIAPQIAIPHAGYNDGVNQLGFSLLKLKHPVRFSPRLNVSVLLMIAPIDNKKHQKAVQAFYDCVSDEANHQELLRQQTPEQLKKFFERKMK
jgi:transcriptional antiterminator/mannitol/fructose-specific phosphotransferase system IIA component (Ntr-type)